MIHRLEIYSDIHNESRRYPPETDGIVILAKNLPAYMNKIAQHARAVILVPGNHEYYSSNLVSAKYEMTADNVHVLDNVTIDGQRFVGTTLWTNPVGQWSKDYRRIQTADYRKLKVEDVRDMHFAAKFFFNCNS